MGVRAKFYVASLTKYPSTGGAEVKLQAVVRGARNADWASATPSGDIRLQVSNPSALAMFDGLLDRSKDGGPPPEVFIEFSVADDGRPGDGHKFVEPDLPADHYAVQQCAACGMENNPANHPNG